MSGNPDTHIRPRTYVIGAIALVLAGVILGLGVSASLNLQRSPLARVTGQGQAVVAQSGGEAAMGESPFAAVADRALPAVVFVDVKKKAGGSDDMPDDFFHFFQGPGNRQRTVPSSGSGFIIDPKGFVLTNNHVVKDAEDITVTLEDKRTFKAKVVGTDPQTDVAVIKIDGERLPTLPLGDSDQLRVGDWAIAIGNPLGVLRGSVTVGVISARGRSGLDIFGGTPQFQDFIQTDASINFGNSGGPLCNIRGEAIGINTAINPSGQGIGFAIPINLARHVADQLIAHGVVKRAMMGVMLADLTPELADGFGIPGRDGVVIQRVIAGSPAEKAGLRRNDVVVAFDGEPVTDRAKLQLKVADTPTGKRVPLEILREGKRMTLSITLSERDEKFLAQNDNSTEQPEPRQAQTEAKAGLGGFTVRAMSAVERRAFGAGGVVVVNVKDGSAAEEAGLQPNDVIEEVNTQPVTSAESLDRLLREARDAHKKHAVLLVSTPGDNGNSTRYVPLRLE